MSCDEIKKILDEIIISDKTEFINRRYIGENIRLALDIIDYTNNIYGECFTKTKIEFKLDLIKYGRPFMPLLC